MDATEFLAVLSQYQADLEAILARFDRTSDGIHIKQEDDRVYRQRVLELRDLLNDGLGPNVYSDQVVEFFNHGISNLSWSPSYKSVENIIGVVRAAVTRISRTPELVGGILRAGTAPVGKNVFIIHGRDEAKWRELKDILQHSLHLNPIVLQEQPDIGSPTLIEKFEHHASSCSAAVAIFTPDDQVRGADGETYLQARPNAIYELGWFCGRLSRGRVILLLKEGTSLFSDFGGIMRKTFRTDVSELAAEIEKDLTILRLGTA